MNLISGVHHSCKMRKHTFMVLQEYTIISPTHVPAPLAVSGQSCLAAKIKALLSIPRNYNNAKLVPPQFRQKYV